MIVEKARHLIDQPITDYEVQTVSTGAAVEFAPFRGETQEVIRLQPDTGAPWCSRSPGFPE